LAVLMIVCVSVGEVGAIYSQGEGNGGMLLWR